ncbi:MAG: Trk system potassium transporter TrkA [Oscillospiraceae bacterium]|nr:Trk system potassium transporter TrkA [Oscillospiraceae bacterium]
MKIVIIGGGKVGYAIASQLTSEGHNITLVDQDRAVTERIEDTLDCMALCGSGATVEVMRAADVPNSDLLIACTAQDELNMLCCVFAKKLGCGNAIARVRTPAYAQQMYLLKDGLSLSTTMNPELTAAREMFRLMEIPGVLKRDSFASGRVEIVEVISRPGDPLDGTKLMDLQKKIKCKALVGAVQRGDDTYIPDGSFTLRAGDKVYICAPATELVHILRAIGEYRKKARRVLLIGGSRVAEYLVEMLLRAGTAVKLIESDRSKAELFAQRFPQAMVLCADGTNEHVLQEENAGDMDAVALMTGRDEQNLILSMYVGSLGVPQLMTQVDHTEFGCLIQDPHNHLISPKQLCADEMVRYVRALQNTDGSSVVTLHHLAGGKVDALEFNVTASCKGKGRMLKDIKLKPNILIACINRMGKIIIPGGLDTMEAGDTVVVITASSRVIVDLNDIFADEG